MDGGLRQTERTTLRRKRERGRYDPETVHAILDEALVCHVGVAGADGPLVLPTAYGRLGDALYLHGAVGNSLLDRMAAGAPACVTVTLLDGLVLARSAFRHSMNYRSVVLVGVAEEVTDPDEKRRALDAIVEHMAPGRSAEARAPDDGELRATRVLRLALDEGSAKVRTGGPNDTEPDVARDADARIWAGVLPLRQVAGAPEPAASLPPDVAAATPPSVVGHPLRRD